jgi:uncharacterized RDD family membrane protein YckC
MNSCKNCGTQNMPTAKFCKSCGNPNMASSNTSPLNPMPQNVQYPVSTPPPPQYSTGQLYGTNTQNLPPPQQMVQYQPVQHRIMQNNQPHSQLIYQNNSGIPGAYQRGDYSLGSRLAGYLIDVLIAIPLMIIAVIPLIGIIGAPLLCLYLVSRDALLGGQSVGKRVAGVRVIRSDGMQFTWSDSIKRNIIYFIPVFLMIPWIGHIATGVLSVPFGLIELILIISGGQRIGDRIGNTYVVKV